MAQENTSSPGGSDQPNVVEMPPLPQRNNPTATAAQPEDPTWWRLGCIPFLVLLMAAAAADLAWPDTETWGLGAGLGCLLAIGALMLLRKDFSRGESLFLAGLAVINFAALVVSGSVINWVVSLVLPFIMVMVPRRQDPLRAGQRFRSWWGYWTSVRLKPSGSETTVLKHALRQFLPTLICILVGAILFIIFLSIFAAGNPVVEAVRTAIVDTWNRLVAYLRIDWDFVLHVLRWVVGILWFGIYTFRRPDVQQVRMPQNTTVPGRTILPLLPICSLIGIDLAFLIATSTDIAFLWFGKVPEGISQTAYLHEGATSITWASCLAAGILIYLFRREGGARRSLACRVAGYALVLQTLLLAVSVYLRLYYQIADFGFTVRRIQAAEALMLGVAGLTVLVLYMACSGSFWKYAKACLASMFLLLIAFSIESPARLAGDLNMHYVPSHPQWEFSYRDFGYGRFSVEENLDFACYVQQRAPHPALAREIRNSAERILTRAEHAGWRGWSFNLSRDARSAQNALSRPVAGEE